MKTTYITNPAKPWWPGDVRVEKFMEPVSAAISRHLPRGREWTDIYNRAYEAVYAAIKSTSKEEPTEGGLEE